MTGTTANELLENAWRRGKEFLGVEVPVICGGMTWVSTSDLVKAVAAAGAFGALAGGNMPPEMFADEVDACRAGVEGSFAVNLVTVAPNYAAQLDILQGKDVPIVVFAGGFPNRKDIAAMKDGGKKVMCFAATEAMARRTLKYGADALIIEGMEAGGHIGHVTLMVLLQEILFRMDPNVPVFAAGGIATGRMVAHLLLMGAAGVQMGTRFVLSEECAAHPEFKQAFLKAQSRHAVQTPMLDQRVQVAPVRALQNQGMEEFSRLQIELIASLDREEITREEALHRVESFWMGALRNAVVDGDVERGSLMAGQSVGLSAKIMPVKEIVAEIAADAAAELERVRHSITE